MPIIKKNEYMALSLIFYKYIMNFKNIVVSQTFF